MVNNPIRYNDPSGYRFTDHMTVTAEKDIFSMVYVLLSAKKILSESGVELAGEWTDQHIIDASNTVLVLGKALASAGAGDNWRDAFHNTFGDTRFVWGELYEGKHFGTETSTCYHVDDACSPGMVDGKYTIAFNFSYEYSGISFSTLISHELAHSFQYLYGWVPGEEHALGSYATYYLGSDWQPFAQKILLCNAGEKDCDSTSDWQHRTSEFGNEVFSDLFTAWAFGAWNTNPLNAHLVSDAKSAMDIKMSEWIAYGSK